MLYPALKLMLTLLVMLQGDKPALFDRAVKVANLDGTETYMMAWLSDDEFLSFKKVGSGADVFNINIRTNARKELRYIEPLFERDSGSCATRISVSPNGKWLSWIGYAGTPPQWGFKWVATNLNVAVRVEVADIDDGADHDESMFGQNKSPYSTDSDIGYWRKDNRRWMKLEGSTDAARLVTFSLSSPDQVQRKPVAGCIVARAAKDPDHAPRLLGETPEGLSMAIYVDKEAPDQAAVFLFNPEDEKPTAQRSTFTPPDPGPIREYLLSPKGDQIAWIVNPRDAGGIQVWLSSTQGKGARLVGVIARGLAADFRWLPSGKAISFVYQGDLYRLPIAPER